MRIILYPQYILEHMATEEELESLYIHQYILEHMVVGEELKSFYIHQYIY